MSVRFVAEGNRVIDYTPSSNVTGGDVVVLTNTLGIAKLDIPAGKLGALAIGGLFEFPKANVEIADDAAVYWDADGNPVSGTAGTGAVNTTSAGNTFAGYAVGGAAATDATVRVRVPGAPTTAVTVHETLSAVIADPGAAGAIPVTGSGHCSIVTTAAQTRTLAAPTFAGQMISITMKTDGGDCTITCSTGINQTGNNTIVLNDAGDSIVLHAVEVGANLRWRVLSNDGCTLSTV